MAESIRRLSLLNGFRVFEVVSRHLNFRIAAEELGVTQGVVAQQVRGPEAKLGMKLFDELLLHGHPACDPVQAVTTNTDPARSKPV